MRLFYPLRAIKFLQAPCIEMDFLFSDFPISNEYSSLITYGDVISIPESFLSNEYSETLLARYMGN